MELGPSSSRSALKRFYKLPTIPRERTLARGGARGEAKGAGMRVEEGACGLGKGKRWKMEMLKHRVSLRLGVLHLAAPLMRWPFYEAPLVSLLSLEIDRA